MKKNIYHIRSNIEESQKVIHDILKKENLRNVILDFLCKSIKFHQNLDAANENWNLSILLSPQNLRFNIGHVYCIDINRKEILILCDRSEIIKREIELGNSVKYRGYEKKKKITSSKIGEVQSCLKSVSDNIGVLINPNNDIELVKDTLNKISDAHRAFMINAQKSWLLPSQRTAHSTGAIDYLAKYYTNSITNPNYTVDELSFHNEIESQETKKAKNLNREKLLENCKKAPKHPNKKQVITIRYDRSPSIIAMKHLNAGGICDLCKNPAPFIKDDGTPYLEIHHLIPLSKGGTDDLENTVALCPNCHRKLHYEKGRAKMIKELRKARIATPQVTLD